MFIIWSLKHLFDPYSYHWEKGERASEAELPEDSESGDPPNVELELGARPPPGPARFRCRVCALESPSGEYCPTCLADSMQPITEPQQA